jgi:hypothetical protein
MKTFTLKSPDGEIVKGWNLSKFSREHNLDINLIGKVVNGEVWQHKGWTHPGKSKEDFMIRLTGNFTLVSPEGEIVKVKNVGKFCNDRGLEYKYVAQVVRGHKTQYKGWTLQPKLPHNLPNWRPRH